MDMGTLVQRMNEAGQFSSLVNRPVAQFGPRTSPYLGATLLPEKRQKSNFYKDRSIQYRSVIADHRTRYSPVTLKGSVLTGYMEVTLGESGLGSQFTAEDYEVLRELLDNAGTGNAPPMSAVTSLLNWADVSLSRGLEMINELMRWQAIVNASVTIKGDDGFADTVAYPNPSGHRFAAGDNWDDDTYDPYDDILAAVAVLEAKGYTLSRIIAGSPVINMLLGNAKIKQKVGKISVAAGTVVGLPGRLTKAELDAVMSDDGLPPIERYNSQWADQTTTGYFLPRDCMVFVANTGRDYTVENTGDANPLVTLVNTIGYLGVGRPAGESNPGKVIKVAFHDDEVPYHISGKTWQTTLPVIQDPEGIVVITDIDPTP
jgi:hypothetical protein